MHGKPFHHYTFCEWCFPADRDFSFRSMYDMSKLMCDSNICNRCLNRQNPQSLLFTIWNDSRLRIKSSDEKQNCERHIFFHSENRFGVPHVSLNMSCIRRKAFYCFVVLLVVFPHLSQLFSLFRFEPRRHSGEIIILLPQLPSFSFIRIISLRLFKETDEIRHFVDHFNTAHLPHPSCHYYLKHKIPGCSLQLFYCLTVSK